MATLLKHLSASFGTGLLGWIMALASRGIAVGFSEMLTPARGISLFLNIFVQRVKSNGTTCRNVLKSSDSPKPPKHHLRS
jgi:multisubunit Na+/H+ antiporter MnhE subunit